MIQSSAKKISKTDFERLSSFIYHNCGIKLPLTKKVLVESRLQKRLIALKLDSFSAYCDFVMSAAGLEKELVPMIDEITTNKTDFFREPMHFDFLENSVLPEYYRNRGARPLKVWSSACSTGEEPYTIAMVLEKFAQKVPDFDYKILATDISTQVLEKAIKAVYQERNIEGISMDLRRKFFMRSRNKDLQTVRIVPELRAKVQFKRLNLMDEVYDTDKDFDMIFCRNVLIYFDRPTQEQVVKKLLRTIKPGGYLFIGHSESVYQMVLPVKQIRPTIFQKL